MRLNLWELSQIVDLLLNFENCGSYYKIQKNHCPSDFCTKSLFCSYHQNLNPILTWLGESKNFLKV